MGETRSVSDRQEAPIWHRVGFKDIISWFLGPLAHLVERLYGIEKVRGSNPLGSTAWLSTL